MAPPITGEHKIRPYRSMKRTAGTNGIVYLVGAGPGDPGLITLAGKRALEKADVIFYDYLANPVLLEFAPKQSKKIYVGKKGFGAVNSQAAIEAALIVEAKKGKTVVRLKGGDPFIFGRGGEEAEALANAHVRFEIIPGVTSAIAVPAYAGIPLTHRDCTSEVVFITGHQDPEKRDYAAGAPNWEALSRMGTVVFLMGSVNLASNLKNLIAAGKESDTRAAFIQWGTHSRQKMILGTIANLAEKVAQAHLGPPAVVVVGKVASLSDKIAWFSLKPLFGQKIVVTRSEFQASELSHLLRDLGAEPIEIPAIQIKPPASFKPLDAAIRKLKNQDWIVFTSSNGVKFFWERLEKQGLDIRALSHAKIAVVGSKTAETLRQKGIKPDLVPKDFSAEGLVKAFKSIGGTKKRVLIPRSAKGREYLIDELRTQKWKVEAVNAYATTQPALKKETLQKVFVEEKPDWVLFTSSSTVEFLVKNLEKAGLKSTLDKVNIACIGPVTRKTAIDFGLTVRVMPKRATIADLANAVVKSVSRDGR